MNLEEARKTLWLRNNHRPLGELLDEGYLNQSRLEWAAEKAYDPALKQAARVILESKQHPSVVSEVEKPKPVENKTKDASLEIGISLDKARSILWPFAPYKGQPMGVLVESKQLSFKDLGYAIETAWDKQVRQAAIALSLVRLEQAVKEPVPSAGFVHVVSGGRSYSERKQSFLTLLEGLITGIIFGFLFMGFVITIFEGPKTHSNGQTLADVVSSTAGILALIVLIGSAILVGWLVNFSLNQVTKKLDKQIEEYRLGQEGEDRAVELIVQALDGNWHLFRNVNLPGRNKGDLDLILVGSPGVWVLEVKNLRGEYRNIGESWEYRRGKNWKTTSTNPSRQALNNALRLANFLKADNIQVFVNAAVVWANQESLLHVENPSVSVWLYNRLLDELGNIWHGEKCTELERNKIADKLYKLCEQQKRSN